MRLIFYFKKIGALLYGPPGKLSILNYSIILEQLLSFCSVLQIPGCGKTLLVRALAATVGARFLAVSPSCLLRKYVGETNLNVRALFSVACKIAPTVIFVDELGETSSLSIIQSLTKVIDTWRIRWLVP